MKKMILMIRICLLLSLSISIVFATSFFELDLENSNQNFNLENYSMNQLDGNSFISGDFTIFIKTKGNYLRLYVQNEEENQFFNYLIQDPSEDQYFTFVDSDGNINNFCFAELLKKGKTEIISKTPNKELSGEYTGKTESVLLDYTYLIKERYITKEGNIPVIITLNIGDLTGEKTNSTSSDGIGDRNAFQLAKENVLSIIMEKSEIQTINEESKVKRELHIINAVSAEVSKEKLDELKNSQFVKKISLDRKVHVFLYDSVALINATQLWQIKDDLGRNITGVNVTVAVIDTGIDYTHPDFGSCTENGFLSGQCSKVIGGYDFVNNDNDPMDDHGHGTHCAGIVAANGTLKGVAPDANLMAFKVLDSGGSGWTSDVIAGIERAVDPNNDGDYSDHVDVISMSLGGSGSPDDEVSQAVDTAVENEVVVVVAAGNSGPYYESIGSPGCAQKALTVGAMCKPCQVGNESYCDEIIASFSSRGPVNWGNQSIIKPDVVAPGVKICSSQWNDAWAEYQCTDDEHTAISGTSMATPHVAGAAALLLQAHPNWRPEEVKSVLMSTAEDLDFDVNTQGTGKINAYKAYGATLATYPQSVSFGRIDSGTNSLSEEIMIKNLETYPIYLTLNASLIKDSEGNYYSFASLNVSNITIQANSQESVLLTVNITSDVEGLFEGEISISDTYRIPFSFIKLSKLTISVKGNEPLYPNIYLHDDNFNFTASASQDFDFEGDTANFFVPSGNYSVYAVSNFDETPLEYILMDHLEVPLSSEVTAILNLSDARPFTIKAQALDGTDLKLYEWQKGFNTYNDEKVFSVNYYDPIIGDRIVYLSNKPDSTLDTDIIFKYVGVPVR